MATRPNRDTAHFWLKSTASADGGNCVEVARSESYVLVRDSSNQSGTVLKFSPAQWHGFVRRLKNEDAAGG